MTEGTPSAPPGRPAGLTEGWAVLCTLIAGIAVWGGVGFALDALLHLTALAPIGVLVGLTSSIYLVYVRAGR